MIVCKQCVNAPQLPRWLVCKPCLDRAVRDDTRHLIRARIQSVFSPIAVTALNRQKSED